MPTLPRRPALYSRPATAAPRAQAVPSVAAPAPSTPSPVPPVAAKGWRTPLQRFSGPLWGLAGAVLAVAVISLWQPATDGLTQDDIDAAVRDSLEREPLPSAVARAYAAIAPSVVRVEADDEEDGKPEGTTPFPFGPPGAGKPSSPPSSPAAPAPERPHGSGNVGTGVVIKDDGTILTNLHVAAGGRKLKVTFHNGQESPAQLIGTDPDNDLAVLKATRLPDDLEAATMRSTADLAPGDHVLAVGFPFGIGPSASAGVVSGLKREFRAPQGQRSLTNLIQFDAAANPGNSGGPLVTMEGHVVGIVTAILNPSAQRTFIGIAFAVPIENAANAAGLHPF
jgi:serine protease DegQ